MPYWSCLFHDYITWVALVLWTSEWCPFAVRNLPLTLLAPMYTVVDWPLPWPLSCSLVTDIQWKGNGRTLRSRPNVIPLPPLDSPLRLRLHLPLLSTSSTHSITPSLLSTSEPCAWSAVLKHLNIYYTRCVTLCKPLKNVTSVMTFARSSMSASRYWRLRSCPLKELHLGLFVYPASCCPLLIYLAHCSHSWPHFRSLSTFSKDNIFTNKYKF